MSVADIVLKELEKLTGTDQVRSDLNLDLFGERVLDSFAAIELVVALAENFGVELTPGEIEREAWATPQMIIDDITRRLERK